ncbi:sensor histidine kinase [Sphingobium aquiterrae]|uniref:sensor histidine kinase n=1 Tax=Sphingobium aquiterrae TaxID=2038656 RepID=UPI00301A4E5A
MQRRNELFVERLPLVVGGPWLAYAAAAGLSLLALAVRWSASGMLHAGYPYVSFFPAVILTSFLFGVRPGIFAGILCGLFAWYLFIPPIGTFQLGADAIVALAFYSAVVTIDIALVYWMQRANLNLALERERSAGLADHRELLFRELQHRVSNNLQVVAALLSLHRRQVQDEAAGKALEEAASRLGLIGRISRALYDPRGQALGVGPYIADLVRDIMESNGRDDVVVATDVEDGVLVHPDTAVPLALIVAETVSNALEHGFPDQRGGRITLRLHSGEGRRLILEVVDDGRGLPDGFRLEDRPDSMGLRIATVLAQQLRGSFLLVPDEAGGTRAVLEMPLNAV